MAKKRTEENQGNIEQLKFDDKNFNKHTEYGMGLLEKSLRENGAGRSVLVDKDDNIIAGNGIVEAVKGLWLALACDRQLVNVVNPAVNSVREFCDEVSKYRRLKLDYTDELRKLDNFEQSVDEGIFTLPLRYLTIRKGLARVFK